MFSKYPFSFAAYAVILFILVTSCHRDFMEDDAHHPDEESLKVDDKLSPYFEIKGEILTSGEKE